MKVANFLLSGLVVAAMGFMATGCNENPSDPGDPGDPGAPGAPLRFSASSLGSSQVGLNWEATSDTGTITYLVSWAPVTGGVAADSSSASVGTSRSHTVTGLTANKEYRFYVRAMRSAKTSGAATITWAGARRFTNDAQAPATMIRMYETNSSAFGSGLQLDAPGPRMVFVGDVNQQLNSVQLAIYTKGTDATKFEIGPAYAFTEYKNDNKFDRKTFVSDSSFPAASLSTWYSRVDIESRIPDDGNVRAFKLPLSQDMGQGFYVRTGDAGNYHYARVFVKSEGGRLLQGNPPNRYVEMEISYQESANLPYAKSAGYAETPGNVASERPE